MLSAQFLLTYAATGATQTVEVIAVCAHLYRRRSRTGEIARHVEEPHANPLVAETNKQDVMKMRRDRQLLTSDCRMSDTHHRPEFSSRRAGGRVGRDRTLIATCFTRRKGTTVFILYRRGRQQSAVILEPFRTKPQHLGAVRLAYPTYCVTKARRGMIDSQIILSSSVFQRSSFGIPHNRRKPAPIWDLERSKNLYNPHNASQLTSTSGLLSQTNEDVLRVVADACRIGLTDCCDASYDRLSVRRFGSRVRRIRSPIAKHNRRFGPHATSVASIAVKLSQAA